MLDSANGMTKRRVFRTQELQLAFPVFVGGGGYLVYVLVDIFWGETAVQLLCFAAVAAALAYWVYGLSNRRRKA